MPTILLLSGGRSERMGQNKSQLAYEGQTLLEWQQSRFEQAGFKVVSNLGDRFKGYKGPLAGIDAACTAYVDVESWIVVPVDMPLISIPALHYIAREGQAINRPAAFKQCPLPLYLPNENSTSALLEKWLSDKSGKRSVFALMYHLDGLWVEPNEFKDELDNINTPDQWQEFAKGVLTE